MNEPDMKYQGYLSALTSAAATISLLPLSWATTHLFGDVKVPVMLLGSCAYLVEMAIFASADLSEDTLVRGQSLCSAGPLVGLYILHGIGRGVWESTNKSVLLDFFPDDAPAAFANVLVSNGGISAAGYLLFYMDPSLADRPALVAIVTMGLAALSIVTFLTAYVIDQSEHKTQQRGTHQPKSDGHSEN